MKLQESKAITETMKIVTYNVNGLRPRVAQHGSLLKLLEALDADIICLQVDLNAKSIYKYPIICELGIGDKSLVDGDRNFMLFLLQLHKFIASMM